MQHNNYLQRHIIDVSVKIFCGPVNESCTLHYTFLFSEQDTNVLTVKHNIYIAEKLRLCSAELVSNMLAKSCMKVCPKSLVILTKTETMILQFLFLLSMHYAYKPLTFARPR
jgi:hypothetical protein